MNRMWEIRESEPRHHKYADYRMGKRDEEEKLLKEAYECGFEDGYEKAMEEVHRYGERSKRY